MVQIAQKCISIIAIYALLWGPFKRLSESSLDGAANRKAAVLSIVWFVYPVVFLVSQEGLRLWSPVFDAAFFTILDLTAKVLYGFWAVSLVQHTGSVQNELPDSGDRLIRGR